MFFGATDPDPVVFDAPIDLAGVATANVLGNPTFGNLTVVFNTVTGTLSLDAPDVPGASIQSMVVTGSVGPLGMSGTYRIEFETSTPAGSRQEGIDFALGTISAAPVAQADPIRITAITVEENQVMIRWTSVSGTVYRVESLLRLGLDSWGTETNGIVGLPVETSASLAREAGDSSNFFRVREIP